MASLKWIKSPVAVLVAGMLGTLGTSACSSGGGEEGSAQTPDDGTGEPAATAACDPARPADDTAANADGEGSGNAHTFNFDGEDRTYLLDLPDDYDGTTAHPLVFNFHGFSANKEVQEAYTAIGKIGAERGYVVVTPDALSDPREWNYLDVEDRADDFGFIDALVADLSERLCIDTDRIYAAGHSAGSAFTGFLVCREPYRFAAVAMVAAFIPTTCPADEVAPSVIAFYGDEDPLVPYDGGTVDGGPGIPAALDTLEQHADAYECDPVVEEQPDDDIEIRTLKGCVQGSEVVLYTINGGGHGWPGNEAEEDIGGQPDNALLGFPGTETILDFFDNH